LSINKKPFIFDGAFGTYYFKMRQEHSSEVSNCELANLENKESVYKIHRAYISEGVDAIKTNTYGANLNLNLNSEKLSEVLESGYEIAMLAAQDTKVEVFADIGYINSERENLAKEYLDITQTFIRLGAKNFLFETFADFADVLPALRLISSSVENACIAVTFAVSQDGYSNKGVFYKNLIHDAANTGLIKFVGLNCTCGPSHMFQLFQKLEVKDLNKNIRLCAMPNAGYPSNENGRTFYRDNIEYFSDVILSIVELGVDVIGGCCGTTPEHIKASIFALGKAKNTLPSEYSNNIEYKTIETHSNLFRENLFSKSKSIAVEIDPPINTNIEYLLSASYKAHSAGAGVITISDSPLARTRADSFLMASKIKREVGIEVLPHLSCRDRNHISIKGSLIAASIEGVTNVLVVTGDPIASEERMDYKGVFSMSSTNLISFIKSMNSDVFANSPFLVGAALNVNANNIELEIKRAHKKMESGSEFFLTQPIFSEASIKNLLKTRKQIDAKLMAGILPIASHRNALFLNNEVPGIYIPQTIIDSFLEKSPMEVEELSYELSVSLIEQIWDSCDGFYLITPLNKIDLVCKIIEFIRNFEMRRNLK